MVGYVGLRILGIPKMNYLLQSIIVSWKQYLDLLVLRNRANDVLDFIDDQLTDIYAPNREERYHETTQAN